jgi:hypothetical protein
MVDAGNVKAALDFEVATCVGTAVQSIERTWRWLLALSKNGFSDKCFSLPTSGQLLPSGVRSGRVRAFRRWLLDCVYLTGAKPVFGDNFSSSAPQGAKRARKYFRALQ